MENLAIAVMQADNLAADAPGVRSAGRNPRLCPELADLGLSVESDVFGSLKPPKAQ